MRNLITKSGSPNAAKKNEGTGVERLVLCFCVLFFMVQMFHGVLLAETSVSEEFNLTILPEAVLFLSVIPDGMAAANKDNVSLTGSRLNALYTPFFFNPVPINFCDKLSLLSIKGIGPILAENILHSRERLGYFLKAEDLLRVDGIGPVRLKTLQSSFSFVAVSEPSNE